MDIASWIANNGTIVHRRRLAEAGYTKHVIHRGMAAGLLVPVRRLWVALPSTAPVLVAAANAGGQLTCESFAEHRGWWIAPSRRVLHVAHRPHSGGLSTEPSIKRHFRVPIGAHDPLNVLDTVVSALRNIALCLPADHAMATWESAVKKERLSPIALQRLNWGSTRARALALRVTNFADSGLDSFLIHRLRHLAVELRPQWLIGSHPCDLLIGDYLIIEVDGFEFHSGSAARSRDVRRDAELAVRGYTTLRFTYDQVVNNWPYVYRTIQRAIDAGLHLGR